LNIKPLTEFPNGAPRGASLSKYPEGGVKFLIVFVRVRFPMEKAQQVAELFAKLMSERPVPEGVKHIGPFLRTTLEDGVVAISLYEVEEGKEVEAFKYAMELEFQFRVIEGYRYSVDLYYTIEEALSLLA